MAGKREPAYLLLRDRTYHFRIVVPCTLQPIFQKREYKKSLRTGDFKTACRIGRKYALFAERYFQRLHMMNPDNHHTISFLIKNHFEKCLLEAEEDIWASRLGKDFEDADTVNQEIIEQVGHLKNRLSRLREMAVRDEFSPSQEKIAEELLKWKQITLQPFQELYKELLRGIMDAHLEKTRLHIAYFERDGAGIIYALKDFSSWTPDNRKGPRLKSEPIPQQDFCVDVELWSLDGDAASIRSMKQAFENWLTEQDIPQIDSLVVLPIYRLRVSSDILIKYWTLTRIKRFPPSYHAIIDRYDVEGNDLIIDPNGAIKLVFENEHYFSTDRKQKQLHGNLYLDLQIVGRKKKYLLRIY